MKYAYYARPIDQAGSQPTLSQDADVAFAEFGLPLFRPDLAWEAVRPPFGPVLQNVNRMALGGAAALVAILPKGVPTLGVPTEIALAQQLDIPVFVLADWPKSESGVYAGDVTIDWFQSPAILARVLGRFLFDSSSQTETSQAGPMAQPSPVLPLVGHYTKAPDSKVCGAAPRAGHPGDAGYDLTVIHDTAILPGERAQLDCGICVELPHGYWGLIQGRSSSWRLGLDVKPSVIDAGYRGPLHVDCLNITGSEVVRVEAGQRIAQLIPMPLVPPIRWDYVRALSETERGSDGYGSTGR